MCVCVCVCVCVWERERPRRKCKTKLWSASLSTSVPLGGVVRAQPCETKRKKMTCCHYAVILQRILVANIRLCLSWFAKCCGEEMWWVHTPIFAVFFSSRFSRIWCVARRVTAFIPQGSDLFPDTVLPSKKSYELWMCSVLRIASARNHKAHAWWTMSRVRAYFANVILASDWEFVQTKLFDLQYNVIFTPKHYIVLIGNHRVCVCVCVCVRVCVCVHVFSIY